MKIKAGLLALGLQLAGGKALAQADTELVQRKTAGVTEEFSVLKADKTVRQGAYIRYRMAGALGGVAVYEAGAYEHGLKVGEWRCFSEGQGWNRLLSKGTYRAGRPEGPWCYYHPNPRPAPLRKAVLDAQHPEQALTVGIEDTTAVVQAKGMCLNGERAGLWRYYNAAGTLVQAINHSANQLVYAVSDDGEPLGGAAVASHPLLYVGGKAQLQWELANALNPKFLLEVGKTASTGVVFSVDSAGRQTGMHLTSKAAPNRFEQLLLAELGKVSTRWLPQVVNGQPTAASYYVLINTLVNEYERRVKVEPFGN